MTGHVLSPELLARVREARSEGAGWAELAEVVSELEGFAWSAGLLSYVAASPVPVHLMPLGDYLNLADHATRDGEPGGPTLSPDQTGDTA